ncbi:hypothetical protein L9F63_012153, partial [Diploptera punctata]
YLIFGRQLLISPFMKGYVNPVETTPHLHQVRSFSFHCALTRKMSRSEQASRPRANRLRQRELMASSVDTISKLNLNVYRIFRKNQ